MRKAKYPCLSDLCLFKNKIVEGDKLRELSAKKINMIRIEYTDSEEQIGNADWLFKIEADSLFTLSKLDKSQEWRVRGGLGRRSSNSC